MPDALLYVGIALLALGWGTAFVKISRLNGEEDEG